MLISRLNRAKHNIYMQTEPDFKVCASHATHSIRGPPFNLHGGGGGAVFVGDNLLISTRLCGAFSHVYIEQFLKYTASPYLFRLFESTPPPPSWRLKVFLAKNADCTSLEIPFDKLTVNI